MLASAALAAAACGEDEVAPATEPPATAGQGGSLVWALAERPRTADPLHARSAAERLVARQIHEPLVAQLAGPFDDARRVPGLAIWARPSSDDAVWRLRLRRGIRFGDGRPFNASAVLANAERWLAAPRARVLLPALLAVDAPRPDLVRFILERPDPDLADRLGSARLGIVSPRALRRARGGEVALPDAIDTGTGPFELRERSADRLLLARNSEWWGADRGLGPALDQLELLVVRDPAERLTLLGEGAVQVASGFGPRELEAVRRDPLLTVTGDARRGRLALERSVRGLDAARGTPVLSSVWRTALGGP